MSSHRPNWRRVKRNRNYSVGEAAKLLGVSKLTVRRWIKNGLSALREKKATLIVGDDLTDFAGGRKKTKKKRQLHELFCCRCRCGRPPAGNMLDYLPRTTLLGRITGLCPVCETVMHKAFSTA